MKIKADLLDGVALDWAVAQCEGWRTVDHTILCQTWVERKNARGVMDSCPIHSLRFSTEWAFGGPIMEKILGFRVRHCRAGTPKSYYEACIHNTEGDWVAFGPTLLVAAMRVFVASKLGDEIDVSGIQV